MPFPAPIHPDMPSAPASLQCLEHPSGRGHAMPHGFRSDAPPPKCQGCLQMGARGACGPVYGTVKEADVRYKNRGDRAPWRSETAFAADICLSSWQSWALASLCYVRQLSDRSAVLSSEGFQDQRSGGVLIPWHQIRQVRNHGTATNIIDLELVNDLYVGSDVMSGAGNIGSDLRRVRVPLDELDTTAGEMVAHIRRLAPHAAV